MASREISLINQKFHYVTFLNKINHYFNYICRYNNLQRLVRDLPYLQTPCKPSKAQYFDFGLYFAVIVSILASVKRLLTLDVLALSFLLNYPAG